MSFLKLLSSSKALVPVCSMIIARTTADTCSSLPYLHKLLLQITLCLLIRLFAEHPG